MDYLVPLLSAFQPSRRLVIGSFISPDLHNHAYRHGYRHAYRIRPEALPLAPLHCMSRTGVCLLKLVCSCAEGTAVVPVEGSVLPIPPPPPPDAAKLAAEAEAESGGGQSRFRRMRTSSLWYSS